MNASATIVPMEDFLESLGGITPGRIIMRPAPGTATEADVIAALEAPRKRICELIDGTLVEKAMGFKESQLSVLLSELLGAFVRTRNLGIVTAPDGTIRLWPGRVRIPDLAFTSWDRMPGRTRPHDAIPEISPNLAIEILSKSNTNREMELKRIDYFTSGVQVVWEIDPEDRTVAVYTGIHDATDLVITDTLSGDPVLPGFSISLADMFAELDRHG